MKRSPRVIFERKGPFDIHYSIQVYSHIQLHFNYLFQSNDSVLSEQPILTYAFDSINKLIRAPQNARLVRIYNTSARGPGLTLLFHLRQCDHSPLSPDHLKCRHCGIQLFKYLKEEQQIAVEKGTVIIVSAGQTVNRNQVYGSKEERELSESFGFVVLQVCEERVRIRRVMCGHESVSFLRHCNFCGERIQQKLSVMQYLIIERTNFISQRLARIKEAQYVQRLLAQRKVLLLLDLDNTLIHTLELDADVPLPELPEAFLFPHQSGARKSLVKVRPHFKSFIQQVEKLYDVFIYTAAKRPYAQFICDHLAKNYMSEDIAHLFSKDRIMTRDDHLNPFKTLRNVLPTRYDLILILDDQPVMWQFQERIIPTRFYRFFSNQENETKSVMICEKKEDCFLKDVVPLLQNIHQAYFHQPKDLFKIKDSLIRQILSSFKIHFIKDSSLERCQDLAKLMGAQLLDQQQIQQADIIVAAKKHGCLSLQNKVSQTMKKHVKIKSPRWVYECLYSFSAKASDSHDEFLG